MECGNCTMCCKHLLIEETDSKEWELCKYCQEDVGCLIYEKRPEECSNFDCCWKQMQVAHIDLRPDNCGVLFEKWSDYVIVGSTEYEITKLILGQIQFFNREGISVLVVDSNNNRNLYLADGHTPEFVHKELENRWQHRLTHMT
jgi:hypothetical protein